jgi:transcriptional regulator with PAS, ATPase and Fis domain
MHYSNILLHMTKYYRFIADFSSQRKKTSGGFVEIRDDFSASVDAMSRCWEEEIRESHKRSSEYGVSRALPSSPELSKLSSYALAKRVKANAPLLQAVIVQMDLIRQILADSSFCAAIADTEGYVLHVIGEGPIMEQYKKRKCLPGYRWQEKDVGTCAIGLALHTRKPILLHGHQMFSASAQHITNSAVPLFDSRGSLVCVICLSGFAEKVHMHTLGMLMQAAENVRLQMQCQERARKLELYNSYMDALVESDSRGVIALDKQGNIIQFNSRAKELVCLSEADKGKDIDKFMSPFSVKYYIQRGESFTDREVVFVKSDSGLKHIASLDLLQQNEAIVGGVLSVIEGDRAMRLVNAMAGGHAVFTFESIIGRSPALEKILEMAASASKSAVPVLLLGETGTGKELFAQAIHNASPRAHAPFVVINCGAIPKELFESELFGYEEGAFTGAQKRGRPGKLELAHKGTLFLDEIGDMPFDMQVKLLRVLQSGELQRLGSSRVIKLDLRIITATNADLKEVIAKKRFREDLYYRISTIALRVPPLRKRRHDILLLAEAFLARYCVVLGRTGRIFSQNAKEAMLAYDWPGNVRQLENMVERAVILAPGTLIEAAHLGFEGDDAESDPVGIIPIEGIENVERKYIEKLIPEYASLSALARALHISRPTLYRKLKKYGLRKPS